MKRISALSLLVFLGACGGKQSPDTPVGDTHPASDLDVALEDPAVPGVAEPPVVPVVPEENAVVTFSLTNTHTEELVFNMDWGWGGSILVFSGKPPKAVSILPFARHCTATCETAAEGICPSCPEPEHLADIRQAQKLTRVLPGETLEVPWDGLVHNYEKAEGISSEGPTSCKCFRKTPAPEGNYTVRACGLRLTQTAKKSSSLQCVEGKLTMPGEQGQSVALEFGEPKKARRRRR